MKMSFTIGSSVREGAITIDWDNDDFFPIEPAESVQESFATLQEQHDLFTKEIDWALLLNKKLFKAYQAEELRRKA